MAAGSRGLTLFLTKVVELGVWVGIGVGVAVVILGTQR